ncbi:unnamed protein product [Sphagnum jensenii]
MEDRIEPNRYDVTVLGTGLPKSVLAASIAACGKRSSSSFRRCEPWKWLSCREWVGGSGSSRSSLLFTPMSESAGGASLGSPQNRFYLDLTGPKVALCVGPLINALLKLQAEHHVKFMAIESSYIWRDHAIAAVPASRSDVFQDQSLSLPDKQFLMQFFKMETKDYRGVETVSGQHLYSGKLITGPSFCVGSVQPRLTEDRGSEEGTAQFSSSEFVVQLSIVCSNSTAGDEALQAAASALFQCENRESDVTDSNGKPKLLWSLFYVQATNAVTDLRHFCGFVAHQVFHKLFPEQDFLPRAVVAANNVED